MLSRTLSLKILLTLTAAGSAVLRADQGPVRWENPVEVDAGEAHRGPWRMNESEFHFVDDPSVALTETGVTPVVWADHTQRDLLLQVFEPDGEGRFENPVNFTNSPDVFSWLPRVVTPDPNAARIYVLWQEIVFSGGSHGGEIFFARSEDGGSTFSEPVNLSNTEAGSGKGRLHRDLWHNGSLDLVYGGRGRLYAAWTDFEGDLWFSHSRDSGASFSEPEQLAGAGPMGPLPARAPALAVSPEGDTVFLAWTVGEDRSADLRLTRADTEDLNFEHPQIIHPGRGHVDAPKLAVDAEGNLHLVYMESPSGPLQDYRIMHTRATGGRLNFQEPAVLSEEARNGFPAIATDAGGRVTVIWERFADHRSRSRGLGYTVSADGGQTFTSPGIVPGTADPDLGFNGSQQGLLMRKLAVNPSGRIAVVNSSFLEEASSRIRLIPGQLSKEE